MPGLRPKKKETLPTMDKNTEDLPQLSNEMQLSIMNRVKRGELSITEALKQAKMDEMQMHKQKSQAEEEQYNFSVHKHSHYRWQKRVLQIDFKTKMLCNIEKGIIKRQFPFSTVRSCDEAPGSKFSISFKGHHDYELEATSVEDKQKMIQLLNQVIYRNIYSDPEADNTETPRQPEASQSLREGILLLHQGGLASFRWVKYEVKLHPGQLALVPLKRRSPSDVEVTASVPVPIVIHLSDGDTSVQKSPTLDAFTLITHKNEYQFRVTIPDQTTTSGALINERDAWVEAIDKLCSEWRRRSKGKDFFVERKSLQNIRIAEETETTNTDLERNGRFGVRNSHLVQPPVDNENADPTSGCGDYLTASDMSTSPPPALTRPVPQRRTGRASVYVALPPVSPPTSPVVSAPLSILQPSPDLTPIESSTKVTVPESPSPESGSTVPESPSPESGSTVPESPSPESGSTVPESPSPESGSTVPESPPPESGSTVPESPSPESGSTVPESPSPESGSTVPESPSPESGSTVPESPSPESGSTVPESPSPESGSTVPESPSPESGSTVPESPAPESGSTVPESPSPESGSKVVIVPSPPNIPPPPPLPFKRQSKKPRTKAFHWDIVGSEKIEKSFWKQENSRRLEINTSRLLEQFVIKDLGMPGVVSQNMQNIMLNKKIAHNFNIFLKRFPVQPGELKDKLFIVSEQDGGLSDEQITSLRRYIPTLEDIDMYKSHKGPVTELHIVDQYMMEMCNIPYLSTQLDLLLTLRELPITLNDLQPLINQKIRMCTQLNNSRSFVSVLEYLLAIGNYLNENARKGKAKGIRLSSLSKLSQLRGKDRTFTLLHALVEQIMFLEPCLATFTQELAEFETVPGASIKGLTAEVDVLKNELQKIIQYTKKSKKGTNHQRFSKDLKTAIEKYNTDLSALTKMCEEMKKLYSAILVKFGESVDQDSQELFGLICQFIHDFKRARVEMI